MVRLQYTLFAATLLLVALSVVAQALPPYQPPYVKLSVSGGIVAEYFDGSRLWLVYKSGGMTHIALYALTGRTLSLQWVSTVPGDPAAVAVTDDLSLLAVATTAKKVVVYDISGRPVLYLERGVRGQPLAVSLASLRGDRVDTLIVIDKVAVGTYWAYAYPLYSPNPRRAELWIQAGEAQNLVVLPVHVAGAKTGLPQVALVYTESTKCYYAQLNASVQCSAVVVRLFNVTYSPEGGLEFTGYISGNVTPGYTVKRETYTISRLDYAYVYYLPATGRYYIAVGVTMQQNQIPNLTRVQITGDINAFIIGDLEDNTSMVRYQDPRVGLLDYYPLGGPVTSFSVSRTGVVAAVGSKDYNVYVFEADENYVYHALYSISLGSSVSVVRVSPLGTLILAGSASGELYAIRESDGMVYWSLPASASVSSVDIIAGYAAFGTSGGQVFAFLNPRVKLYYLGVQLNMTNEPDYVLEAPVHISLRGVYNGMLVEENATGPTLEFTSRPWFTLLPSTNYTLTIDHEILGIAVYSVPLSANVIYTLQPSSFTLPYYNLTVCILDALTGKPPADAVLVVEQVPFPGQNATILATYEYPVPREGCVKAILPRGYYTLRLSSWRYPPRLPGINATVKLWGDLVLHANVTPYTAEALLVRAETTYGMPLSGVNVTLYDPATGLRYSIVTGGGGQARLTNIPYGVYRVEARYPFTETLRTTLLVNTSGVVELRLALKPKVYLVTLMFVEAGTGAPVHPVTFTLYRPVDGYRVETTLYKRNYIVLPLEYGYYTLTVNATGYKPYTMSLIVDKDALIYVRLVPILYTVRISVVDAIYQRPMPSRIIIVNPELGSRVELNAPAGFATVQLHAGNYTVEVRPYYGLPATTRLIVPAVTSITVQVTPRNYTVTVIPVDAPTGKPLAELGYRASGYIVCSDTGNWSLEWRNGELVAEIPYSRSCTLHLTSPAYNPATLPIGDINRALRVEARMEPKTYTLTLVVKSEYGMEIGFNATIRGGPLGETIRVSSRTGRASVDLRPGNYTVTVASKYHVPNTTRVSVTSDTSLTVTLRLRVYRVTLRIVDETTGGLVNGAIVTIERLTPKKSKPETIVVERGVATLPLTWGSYRVTVTAKGYEDTTTTINVPETLEATIPLKPMIYTLELRVIDALTKKPVPNATVILQGVRSGVLERVVLEKGEAKLELRGDTYRIVVTAKYHLGYEATIDLFSPRKLEVTLKPVNYTVTLRVYDGFTHQPYRGKWWVLFVRKEGGFRANITLEGPTATVTIPYGTYTVTAGAPRYDKYARKDVRVYSDITNLPLPLPRKQYTVTVKVLDPRGPVANAIVRLVSLEARGQSYTDLTNNDGEATFTVPWGRYMLEVQAGGYHPYSTTVEVQRNGQTIPVLIQPTLAKIILDLLPAIIIAGAIVGSAAWVAVRVRRKPVSLELVEEGEE